MLGGSKPKGISLHVGLNRVDPVNYVGWKGELVACENDARDMETIARGQGFVTQSLLTRSATSTSLLSIIEKAAKELVEGDMFLLTYSGHGGQIKDVDNSEPDGLDETWVLYDRELVDDELYAMWLLFRPGVRICVVADSCHSGITTKEMFMNPRPYLPRLEARVRASTRENLTPKCLPLEVQAKIYKERAGSLYDAIRRKTPRREAVLLECRAILISACRQPDCDGRTEKWPVH